MRKHELPFKVLADQQAELARRAEEIERLKAERLVIQNDSRVLTCVFCGHQYEPGTPASNHEALKAHVAVCPSHPAAIFRQRAEAAEAKLVEAIRWIANPNSPETDGEILAVLRGEGEK